MKKLISLLLVVILVCSALAGCDWNSIFNRNEPTIDEDTKMKQMYLSQFKIQNLDAEDVVIDYDGGTYNGARIVMLDAEHNDPEEWTETIGDTMIKYYDSNRLYAYKDDCFMELNESYGNALISKNDLIKIASDFANSTKHFRDTCDKFDFPEFWIWEPGEEYREFVKYDKIDIRIDRDIIFTDKNWEENLIKYLGEDIIKRVVSEGRVSVDYIGYALELYVPGEENIQYVFERLSKVPGVLSAGYYVRYGVAQSTNDSYYSHDGTRGLEYIDIEKVWDFTTGSSLVHVGIVDSGIGEHNDLIDNLASWYSRNFITNPNEIVNTVEHGTKVAGVIGAVGNNEAGICGVNWMLV